MRAGIPLFIIVGRMTHPELGDFVATMAHKIEAFRDRHEPPFIAKVFPREPHKKSTHTTKAGRVEMILTYDEWSAQHVAQHLKRGKS